MEEDKKSAKWEENNHWRWQGKWRYDSQNNWWEITCPLCGHINRRWLKGIDMKRGKIYFYFICDACKKPFPVK